MSAPLIRAVVSVAALWNTHEEGSADAPATRSPPVAGCTRVTSLALRLTLADPGRTLTDEEIEAAVAGVRDALDAGGAHLRA